MNRKILRKGIQAFFLLLTSWGIYRFYQFIYHGGEKPDLTDGFCPIVGTFDIFLKIKTGITDPFHPAAMAIVLTSIITTLLFGKIFCSYVCPVGSLLDLLISTREKLIPLKSLKKVGEKITSLKYYPLIDGLLRAPKFLVAGWFLYTMAQFPPQVMVRIMESSNAQADISLFKWWLELFRGEHPLAATILTAIGLFSAVIPRFWCRYLCPLGAFYGVFNLFSLTRIRRDRCTCKGCGSCDGCSMGLKPSKMAEFNNTECTACLECGEKCPSGSISPTVLGRRVPLWAHTLLSAITFLAVIEMFKLWGLWKSGAPRHLLALFLYHNGLVTPWVKKSLGLM